MWIFGKNSEQGRSSTAYNGVTLQLVAVAYALTGVFKTGRVQRYIMQHVSLTTNGNSPLLSCIQSQSYNRVHGPLCQARPEYRNALLQLSDVVSLRYNPLRRSAIG